MPGKKVAAVEKIIFLVDMQSFFVSVEQQLHGYSPSTPIVVSGDPSRPSGVILAACPLAKRAGVKNGERLREARMKCPHLTVTPPHMEDYLNYSIQITRFLETFTELVEPYSIDEQFMDVTGSVHLFGDAQKTAQKVQELIDKKLGIRARLGIGTNKVLAKMACDLFAKRNADGVDTLTLDQLSDKLWPLPIEDLFRCGRKMSIHLRARGIQTIGDFAAMDAETVRKEWGVHGQVLWMNARGVDYSPVSTETLEGRKAIGSGMTLPFDYIHKQDLHTVLLELCEEICRRARKLHLAGKTISVAFSGKNGSFHRSSTRHEATSITMEVFETAAGIVQSQWKHHPVRRVHVSLSSLTPDDSLQLSLLEDVNEKSSRHQIGYTMDKLKEKYGATAVIRASSLLKSGQAEERASRIGGHYK